MAEEGFERKSHNHALLDGYIIATGLLRVRSDSICSLDSKYAALYKPEEAVTTHRVVDTGYQSVSDKSEFPVIRPRITELYGLSAAFPTIL